jgi:hypothetical protein
MLSRILPFVAAVFFAPPAPVGTQGPPPGWQPPAPPKSDEIVWGTIDASVLDVTPKVKQDLEARPGHEKLRIILRHGGTDAQLATLAAMLPWAEAIVLDEPTKVTSLAPIAKLRRLTTLHVNGNAIKTLAPLAKHPALESLTMTCTKDFTDNDLSALADLTTLRVLDLRSCVTIKDLHGLEKVTDLQALSTYGTPIASIDALAGHAKMRSLHLHDNSVSNLAALAGMPDLAIVNLRGSTAASFDALRGLTKLASVDVSRTNIKSLDVLAASTGLWSLDAQDAKALTLASLPSWPKITMLHIDGTNVADVTPIAKLTSLGYVSFDRTPVKSIAPLMAMPSLKDVTMPAAIPDAEILAMEKAHPGIGLSRYGKPLPGRPPPVPIP